MDVFYAVTLLVVALVASEATDKSSDFTAIPPLNKTVRYRVIQSKVERSLVRCSAACLQVESCRYFSYCKGTGKCVLNDASVVSTSGLVEAEECLDFKRGGTNFIQLMLFHYFSGNVHFKLKIATFLYS